MDLAKIIDELRTELDCLNAAIASMEQLARVQNTPNDGAALPIPESGQPAEEAQVPPPAKRRRGRPRKQDSQQSEQTSAGSSVSVNPDQATLSVVPAA
jgi:hypothetical protein